MLKRSKPPYKPEIFRRALALVLVPFILGIVLLFWLNALWSSSRTVLRDETRQWIMVSMFSWTFSSWATATATTMRSSFKAEESAGKYDTGDKYHVHEWFGHISDLAMKDPRALANVRKFEQIYTVEQNLLAEMPIMSSSGSVDVMAIQKMPAILAKLYKNRTEFGVLLNVERVQLDSMRKRGDEGRAFLRQILYFCCFSNVAFAVLMSFLFSRSISSRLKILMVNANCLPRLQKFPERVKGNDELAYLDGVLGEAESRLEAAAEHRRSIIGMVAHDMRSPLMAAQAALEMVEELGGDFSDEAFAAFQRAFKDLDGILVYVQELLTVQKKEFDQISDKSAVSTVSQDRELSSKSNPIATCCKYTSEFFLRPKILQKGLVLVAVPLAIQTALLLAINYQIIQSEALTVHSRQLSEGILDREFMQLNLVRGAMAEAIYVFSGREKFQKLAKKIFVEMDDRFNAIENTNDYDVESKRLMREARRVFAGQISQIMDVKPSDPPEKIGQVFDTVSEVNSRSPQAFKFRRESSMRRLRQNIQMMALDEERNQSAQDVSESIGISILLNFLVAAGLLFVFNRDVHNRLNILIGNASKLGQRKPLQGEVKGTDEFAFLDLSLHHAEVQISEASEQRAQIMASLAHEMRAPLQDAQMQLKLFAELSEKVVPARSKTFIDKAQRNIDRVLVLIENLLTLESLDTGKVFLQASTCDAHALADESIATVATLAQKKKITLKNECESVLLPADREKTVQVLVNLLGNAIKFSPENTTIKIDCHKNNNMLRISVHDEGPGMDEATRLSVFEKFFQAQTAQKEQGFGLGLAICKLIVESHGGVIGVESTVGVGTTFWFELPLAVPAVKR